MKYRVKLQRGLLGYVQGHDELEAASWDGLKELIRERIDAFTRSIIEADERDGDLRSMSVPRYPSGYPSLAGSEPELGEDCTVSVLEATVDGKPLGYHSRHLKQLRSELGVG